MAQSQISLYKKMSATKQATSDDRCSGRYGDIDMYGMIWWHFS